MLPRAYKRELEAKIQNHARVNLLSPKQTRVLLKLDCDTDFLLDKVGDYLKTPDVKHLRRLFLPEIISPLPADIDEDIAVSAVAFGDIIGSRYEFTEHNYLRIDTDNLIHSASSYTDDTVLSYATFSALRANARRPDFRSAYLNAYRRFPNAGYGAAFKRWAKGIEISNREGYGSFANGSAMRVASVGFHYDNIKSVIKQAIRSASTTHNHQDGIKGAVVTAVVIWMARNGYSKAEIKEYARRFYHFDDADREFLLHSETYFDLDTPLSSAPNAISKSSIYCNYAVPFAIKCFLETNSYKECMAEILRHYGDTDTICAIAGGICYAYYLNINLSEKDLRAARTILSNAKFIQQ